jgi:hypothetical protein
VRNRTQAWSDKTDPMVDRSTEMVISIIEINRIPRRGGCARSAARVQVRYASRGIYPRIDLTSPTADIVISIIELTASVEEVRARDARVRARTCARASART